MIWIPITLFAACVQAFRFMIQKSLRMDRLSSGGATYARFLFAAPLIVIFLIAYLGITGQCFPKATPNFLIYAAVGGVCQIGATMCLMALFQQRNFAVGITLIKTEVLMTVPIGIVVLGDGVTPMTFGAIVIGVLGVIALSDPPKPGNWFNFSGPAMALGLGAGVLFGLCSVMYRGATLNVDADDVFLRASFALTTAICFQLAVMSIYLRVWQPGQITAVVRNWRVARWVGVLSLFGSMGWFTAFALQNAAYVKALGQIEVVLSVGIATLVFKEKFTRLEASGIALITLSVVVLILSA